MKILKNKTPFKIQRRPRGKQGIKSKETIGRWDKDIPSPIQSSYIAQVHGALHKADISVKSPLSRHAVWEALMQGKDEVNV